MGTITPLERASSSGKTTRERSNLGIFRQIADDIMSSAREKKGEIQGQVDRSSTKYTLNINTTYGRLSIPNKIDLAPGSTVTMHVYFEDEALHVQITPEGNAQNVSSKLGSQLLKIPISILNLPQQNDDGFTISDKIGESAPHIIEAEIYNINTAQLSYLNTYKEPADAPAKDCIAIFKLVSSLGKNHNYPSVEMEHDLLRLVATVKAKGKYPQAILSTSIGDFMTRDLLTYFNTGDQILLHLNKLYTQKKLSKSLAHKIDSLIGSRDSKNIMEFNKVYGYLARFFSGDTSDDINHTQKLIQSVLDKTDMCGWGLLCLPLKHKEDEFLSKLYFKREQGEQRRFIVENDLKNLGTIWLDVLYKQSKFLDIIIRSEKLLPSTLVHDIDTVFSHLKQDLGFIGKTYYKQATNIDKKMFENILLEIENKETNMLA